MTPSQPPSGSTELDRIKAMRDVAQRALAAHQYVQRHQRAVIEGSEVRDAAAVEMASSAGPTATARHLGLSLGRIKQLRAARRA